MSNLKNDFDKGDLEMMFDEFPYCWQCGSRKYVAMHHILKRVSKSILNGYALCFKCHENVKHDEEEHMRFLKEAFEKVSYVLFGIQIIGEKRDFKPRDIRFIENHIEFYDFLLTQGNNLPIL